jgi:hypothetical protein
MVTDLDTLLTALYVELTDLWLRQRIEAIIWTLIGAPVKRSSLIAYDHC